MTLSRHRTPAPRTPAPRTPVPRTPAHRTHARRALLAGLAAALLAAPLAGCGTDDPTSSPSGSTAASTAGGTATAAASLTVSDGWAKAAEASGPMAMTAVFGTLRNPGDREVTVTGGSSPAATRVELHETVRTDTGEMQMQEKDGGLVVPAGGQLALAPGGTHVMLLGLTSSLENGATVQVTLTTTAGDVALTVPVRTFAGGSESYEPSPSS
ncbi:MAG TPA: copper chaperone PCu(A)C [Dermatophilaceae bacterium]|nr:copper chaperone PCu(A)C [Dermatophilaceae bacterium]